MRDPRCAQGAQSAQGALRACRVRRACTCGQPRRTSDALDARVKRSGQMHDNLNITLKCEDTFFVYPERVQEFLEIWFFAALPSCLHCFADGRTHLCQIICQKDVYITLKIAKACRLSSLGV